MTTYGTLLADLTNATIIPSGATGFAMMNLIAALALNAQSTITGPSGNYAVGQGATGLAFLAGNGPNGPLCLDSSGNISGSAASAITAFFAGLATGLPATSGVLWNNGGVLQLS
jgi:hypothetical protein